MLGIGGPLPIGAWASMNAPPNGRVWPPIRRPSSDRKSPLDVHEGEGGAKDGKVRAAIHGVDVAVKINRSKSAWTLIQRKLSIIKQFGRLIST